MPVALTCPECGGKLRVPDTLAGKKIKCPKCAALLTAPEPAQEAAITADAPAAPAERITSTVKSPADEELEEELDEEPVRPRRKIRRDPTEEAVSTLIPYKNGRALAAYYCGVFSLIPCLGLALGPAALILGILGLRYVKMNPTAKGTGHAIAGLVMGILSSLGNWGVALLIMVGAGLSAFK